MNIFEWFKKPDIRHPNAPRRTEKHVKGDPPQIRGKGERHMPQTQRRLGKKYGEEK